MTSLIRTLLTAAGVLALLLAPVAPASAKSRSGSDSRPYPARVFAATSPLYQKLPAATPAAPDSTQLIASLNAQAHKYYGTPTDANVNINTNRFSPALYVANNSDPVFDITGWNCQRKWDGWDTDLNRQLRNIHVPADLQPDQSTDGSVSIYNVDTHELVELWKARKTDGRWQACWGGRIARTDQSRGTFGNYYGVSASGLALWGLTIRQQELLDGHINHVINLAIPLTKRNTISWPANRTDGNSPGTQLAVGQMLRLPASLDLSKLKLSPAARTVARAAQEYGVVISDTSGSVAFAAENPIALAHNAYSTIFRDRWPFLEMTGIKGRGEVPFPLDKLVALPLDYQVPPAASGGKVTVNTAYAAAVKKARPDLHWRLADTGSVATDASGRGRAGTLVGVTRHAAGAIRGNTAIQTDGDPTSGAYQSAKSTPSASFSLQVWFRTTTTAGGKLAGFENVQTGKGSRADRSLYLTNSGRLVFGTYRTTIRTVTGPKSYNDGRWHQATATQAPGGTKLYVDGALVASTTLTGAQPGDGYWRIGGGNLDGWPSQPTSAYFAGSLDEFAYYATALSAGTIAAQFKAAA
ncbi:MAG TPA: LamG domain-containing protein [Propionicimonas sp.]|uniref:LamG domain-containing protein n=1 Tax=Propionicimonas sp. TaxID=1955623 RepID=UPI002F425646